MNQEKLPFFGWQYRTICRADLGMHSRACLTVTAYNTPWDSFPKTEMFEAPSQSSMANKDLDYAILGHFLRIH